MDPAVKKQIGFIAQWTGVLSLVLEAVFLVIRKWDLSVLLGNLGGAAAAVGNFILLARTVSKALDREQPQDAARRVQATAMLRLLGLGGVCALLVGVFHTNVYATLIPLLFPRIALAVWPMKGRKAAPGAAGEEGSDLLD